MVPWLRQNEATKGLVTGVANALAGPNRRGNRSFGIQNGVFGAFGRGSNPCPATTNCRRSNTSGLVEVRRQGLSGCRCVPSMSTHDSRELGGAGLRGAPERRTRNLATVGGCEPRQRRRASVGDPVGQRRRPRGHGKGVLRSQSPRVATLGVRDTLGRFEEFSLSRGESLLSLSGLDGHDLRALFARRDAFVQRAPEHGEIAIAGMGWASCLARLAPRFRMGIVTSRTAKHFEIIHARSGLLRHFEFHVVREDYPLSKPHPDAYLAGIERTGLPPDRCVAIEDSPRGVAAAQAAGLEVILFAPGGVGLEREVGSVLSRVETADELEQALVDWAGR